jgi:hypothetical protein
VQLFFLICFRFSKLSAAGGRREAYLPAHFLITGPAPPAPGGEVNGVKTAWPDGKKHELRLKIRRRRPLMKGLRDFGLGSREP